MSTRSAKRNLHQSDSHSDEEDHDGGSAAQPVKRQRSASSDDPVSPRLLDSPEKRTCYGCINNRSAQADHMVPGAGCLADPDSDAEDGADDSDTDDEPDAAAGCTQPKVEHTVLGEWLRARIASGEVHQSSEWDDMLATAHLSWKEKMHIVCLLMEEQRKQQIAQNEMSGGVSGITASYSAIGWTMLFSFVFLPHSLKEAPIRTPIGCCLVKA